MSIAHVCLAPLGRGLQIILQPPYLCSLHTCSPKAQAPKGIIQESLVLQTSELFTKIQDLFRPPEVITSPTCYICYIYSYQEILLVCLHMLSSTHLQNMHFKFNAKVLHQAKVTFRTDNTIMFLKVVRLTSLPRTVNA